MANFFSKHKEKLDDFSIHVNFPCSDMRCYSFYKLCTDVQNCSFHTENKKKGRMRFQFPWKVKDFFSPYIILQEKENYCDFIFLFKHNLQEPVQRYEEPFWATADETGRDPKRCMGVFSLS